MKLQYDCHIAEKNIRQIGKIIWFPSQYYILKQTRTFEMTYQFVEFNGQR